jgi:DnaJ-class molecular chaperone
MFLRPLVKAYRVAPTSLRFFSTVPKIDKCLYKTLGVKKDSNTLEIKEAYLKKAREFHPDKNPDALEFFTHCTKAYEILGDDHKRAIYDEESITDEEFFTLKIGSVKINMFTIFM